MSLVPYHEQQDGGGKSSTITRRTISFSVLLLLFISVIGGLVWDWEQLKDDEILLVDTIINTDVTLNDTLAIVSFVPNEERFVVETKRFLFPSWDWSLRHSDESHRRPLVDLLLFVDAGLTAQRLPSYCRWIDVDHDHNSRSSLNRSELDIGERIMNIVARHRELTRSSEERSRCFAIVHRREADNVWEKLNYKFMHSLDYVVEPRYHSLLSSYSSILRTDLDVFLTPKLMSWRPTRFVVGHGSYVHLDFTRQNLKAVAQRLGLRHQGIHNIGSTWMGDSKTMLSLVELVLKVGEHMLRHEYEGIKPEWSKWWPGVTSMYAQEIAVNHLLNEDEFEIHQHDMDHESSKTTAVSDVFHIHCWHTSERFSKSEFQAGAYQKEAYPLASLNLTEVRDYCTFLALHDSVAIPPAVVVNVL